MPQINLLTAGSKKKVVKSFSFGGVTTEFDQVFPAIFFRSFFGAGVCLALWVALLFGVSEKEKALRLLKEKVSVLASNPEAIGKLTKERNTLQEKIKLIEALSSRKFFWYEKLNLLAGLIPDGIWLTEINTRDDKTRRKNTRGALSNQPDNLDEKTVFVIKGTAAAPKIQDAVGLIGTLISSLQSKESFSGDFSEIKLNTATKGSIGGTDVMNFDFVCESK